MMISSLLSISIAFVTSALAPEPHAVDVVIDDARIWSDGLPSFAEFAAIDDGRFVYVGPRDERWIGDDTMVVNADGHVVIPGLFDSHIHMLGGGRNLAQLQLRDAADQADFVARVKSWSDDLPEGKWILGGRWSVESWDDRTSPSRFWVDPVTGNRPLYLSRMDGHSALANSAALAIAGIDRNGPPDPEGGVIDRDPLTNEPTGILRESAMGLVSRHIPPTTVEDDIEAMRRAMDHAVRHGITSVSDIPGMADLPMYRRLVAMHEDLPVRLFVFPTAMDWARAAGEIASVSGVPRRVEMRGFKTYLDGSLGSRTAFMRRPFRGNEPGREDWRGLLREGVEDGRFARNVAAANRAGVQTIVHAIGDEANHILLNTLESTYDELIDARCRAEHSQHLLPTDIPRFGELGVIASMQPYHKSDDGRYAEGYIGPDRSRSSYAFKSLLDAGAVVVFGSDWPVVSLNPFLGIEAAVTGATLAGEYWQTQENLTVHEALRCYTSRGAYAVGAEDELGRIAPGYLADFVILDRSPFAPGVAWSEIRPMAVYRDGVRIFDVSEHR